MAHGSDREDSFKHFASRAHGIGEAEQEFVLIAGTVAAESGAMVSPGNSPGTLKIAGNYLQALQPSWTPQSGFVYSVFTLAGLTYEFDTSTDLKTWTPVAQQPGGNVLVDFRHMPPGADAYRFYRVIQQTP